MSVEIRKRTVLLAVIALALAIAGLWWMFGSRDGRMSSGANTSPRPPEAPPLSIIEHVAYRKTSEFDPGTIRVYLRNTTARDMRFDKVLLDGLPIPVWGVDLTIENTAPSAEKEQDPKKGGDTDEHKGVYKSAAARFSGKRILWAKLSPSPIPSGHIGEFSAKLVNPLPRPMKIEFLTPRETGLSCVVRPVNPAVYMSTIAFSKDLRRMYVYLKGRTPESLKMLGMELNGASLEINCGSLDKYEKIEKKDDHLLWVSSRTLTARETQLAILDLNRPLIQGEYINVRAIYEEGVIAEERVRVFEGFPVNVESGLGSAKLGLDDDVYTMHPLYAKTRYPEKHAHDIPQSAYMKANYLFACHMHKYGSDQALCAKETIRRHRICLVMDPRHPTFNHLCRIRPETGYALFAETADILRINPNITTGMSQTNKDDPPEAIVQHIAEHAVCAARPRPVHSLADTTACGKYGPLATATEFRKRTYATLGCGVKGLFYRHHKRPENTDAAILEEIRRINAEIRPIRGMLAIADRVDRIGNPDRADISSYSLIAGTDALLVILVKHDIEHSKANSKGRSPSRVRSGRLHLSLSLPNWFIAGTAKQVTTTGLRGIDRSVTSQGNIDLPIPEVAAAFVIEGKTK